MDLGLSGRRALVAGASRGLGYATAKRLTQEGARVAICSSSNSIHEAAEKIGNGIVGFVVDVADSAAAMNFVAQAADALGGIDILVTNAGGPPSGSATGTEISAYLKGFELNCLSAIAMCDAAVPMMKDAGWGRVVAITSIAARQPAADLAASSVARAGLTAYLKLLARDMAPHGITVNSIQPGYHATARLKALGREGLESHIPMRRLGDPSDFGAIVTMLCAEQAGYLTGAAIPVDGGAYPGLI
ncbi:MAG: short-chain dehydrogenase [Acidobacteria bacterium]|nr:MAG: short-chain dehydrogenase [Acidobacteriota bacterium]